MDPAWITAITALVVAVTGCALYIGRRTLHVISQVLKFLDDWNGEPARDGIPARLGVMARITRLEAGLQHVVDETRPNGGSSLRDVANKTQLDVSALRSRVELFETQREGREA